MTLGGVVNTAVTDWNGNNTPINDNTTVTGTLTSLTRLAGENVGGYNYTAGTLALSGASAANYSGAAFVPGASLLNITPASLAITADDNSRAVGVPNPPFTATYSGFQFGETPAVLGGALVITTPATIASPAGLYPIVPSGQTSTNYAISYFNGTLTVGGGLPPPVVTPPPSVPRVAIENEILRPQFAAQQRLGAGDFRSELSDCVRGARLLDVAAMWGVIDPSANQWACEGFYLSENSRAGN